MGPMNLLVMVVQLLFVKELSNFRVSTVSKGVTFRVSPQVGATLLHRPRVIFVVGPKKKTITEPS